MLRYLIVPVFALGATGWSADTQPTAGPLGETFTMILKDSERTFVVHNGISYLQTKPEDFADHDFLNGKDVMLLAKFQADSMRAVAMAPIWRLLRLSRAGA